MSRGDRDRLAQTAFDAILYDLVVIGEAVSRLSEGLRGRETTVPWEDIIGMRNVIAHEYFRVHSEVVSATIDAPLRDLEVACRRLRSGDSQG